MILLIIILLVITDAWTDALFYKEKKSESKIIEIFYKGGLFILPVIYLNINIMEVFNLIVIYLFIQIALFDISFNILSGLNTTHIGTTSYWDKLLKNIKTWQFWVLRLFFITLAIIVFIKTI